jgi:7-cyano-7-deazaguanine synthase in queuosine biosynthesis
MKNCVVWSGGLDSTLVLHELIKQKAEDVSTISFVSDAFGSRKQELEKHARISYMKNVSKELIPNEEIPIVIPYRNIKGKNESLCSLQNFQRTKRSFEIE